MSTVDEILRDGPRTMEEELVTEIDWFFEVTGRAPEVLFCSQATIDAHVKELNERGTRGSFLPLAHAYLYRGAVVPIQHDDSLPRGSWRAE